MLSMHLIVMYFIAFTNYPVFDAKIIICLHCMHDYKQPHETNLNIKKKWLPLSLFSHLLVEYEECDRFNPHEGFEILIILSFLLTIIWVFCMTNLNYSKQFSLRSTNSLFASSLLGRLKRQMNKILHVLSYKENFVQTKFTG